jgi:hypothetical protein
VCRMQLLVDARVKKSNKIAELLMCVGPKINEYID